MTSSSLSIITRRSLSQRSATGTIWLPYGDLFLLA
uniref:Uncharacterized protein n=1 Tax=Rhizophora mucronata TaxID=61149 RepID=A0A2P2QAC8_RHIMU